jgi:MGT family glycosyltransferase
MARLLAYSIPGKGHLFPLMPVLEELRGRGHTVTLLTGADDVELARELGYDAYAVAPEIESVELNDWTTSDPRKALRLSVQAMSERAKYDSVDFKTAVERFDPDVAIVDANAWGAIFSAEAWGGPWALFFPYPMPLSSKDVPPFGPGLRPARGPIGRLRDRALRPILIGSLERELVPSINDVRHQIGLGDIHSVDDMFSIAPLVLSTTATPFEYPRSDLPENVLMIGACDWDPPADPPEWLSQLERPVVLVTTSTLYQGDEELVTTAFAALADEPVEVVATLPSSDPRQFELPANGRVESYLPHGLVLERAACAITHGGMGGTQKALAHGVPVCVVPFGRDQSEVARRVEVSGAGTRLPAKRLTVDRLRVKVREAMAMAEGAQRVADGFEAAGKGRAAVDAIEARLLAGPDARLTADQNP